MTYKNRFRENSRSWRLIEFGLVHHEVAPHLRQWFARSRLDYLLWYPCRLADTIAALIFGLIFADTVGLPGVAVISLIFGGLILWASALLYRLEIERRHDFEQVLKRYVPYSVCRSLAYTLVVVVGVAILPQSLLLPLVLLHCATIRMSATAYTTLPHCAAINMVVMTVPVIIALIWYGGLSGFLAAVVLLVVAGYSISAIYNHYYIFATRRLRTKTMKEANETVNLLLNQFAEQSNDWLWEIDKDGRLVDPPARLADSFGIDRDMLSNCVLRDLMQDGPDVDRILEATDELKDFKDMPCPLVLDGKRRWVSLSGRPQFDRDGVFIGYRGFATDISARREAEEQVAFLAHYDTLTELPNRHLFKQTLNRLLNRRGKEQMTAVLYVDLAHFKEVNESHGHQAGDVVLKQTAARLEGLLGAHDMVARLSGDEFGIIVADVEDRQKAVHFAENVVSAFEEPMNIAGANIVLGASVGLAFAPYDGENADELLRATDIALDDAKRKGRRTMSMFNEEMQHALQDRRNLEADLRHAISEGKLDLHFQPLVETATAQVCGYEALLRWNHAERGAISPESFIGLAEESGLIVQLGEWVIREALFVAATWPEHLTVAVNLSPTQLRSERLLPTIINALSQSGVDARRLEIEITESVLLDKSKEHLAKLHKLRELGVRIALDDFGTGYSSLNYLRSFPFDKIKIDRCFVEDIADSRDNQAIVEAVLSLAEDLDMVTTAEGVETEAQLSMLKANGCKQVQGFLFSRAVPASELGYGPICKPVSNPSAMLAGGAVRTKAGGRARRSAMNRKAG